MAIFRKEENSEKNKRSSRQPRHCLRVCYYNVKSPDVSSSLTLSKDVLSSAFLTREFPLRNGENWLCTTVNNDDNSGLIGRDQSSLLTLLGTPSEKDHVKHLCVDVDGPFLAVKDVRTSIGNPDYQSRGNYYLCRLPLSFEKNVEEDKNHIAEENKSLSPEHFFSDENGEDDDDDVSVFPSEEVTPTGHVKKMNTEKDFMTAWVSNHFNDEERILHCLPHRQLKILQKEDIVFYVHNLQSIDYLRITQIQYQRGTSQPKQMNNTMNPSLMLYTAPTNTESMEQSPMTNVSSNDDSKKKDVSDEISSPTKNMFSHPERIVTDTPTTIGTIISKDSNINNGDKSEQKGTTKPKLFNPKITFQDRKYKNSAPKNVLNEIEEYSYLTSEVVIVNREKVESSTVNEDQINDHDEELLTDADDSQNISSETHVLRKVESEPIYCDVGNEDEEKVTPLTIHDHQVHGHGKDLLTDADDGSDDDSQNILSQTPVIKKGESKSTNDHEKQLTDADDSHNSSGQTYVTQKGESESIPCDEGNEDEENIVSSTINDNQVCDQDEELLTNAVDIGKHILSEKPIIEKGESKSSHAGEGNKNEKQMIVANDSQNTSSQTYVTQKGESESIPCGEEIEDEANTASSTINDNQVCDQDEDFSNDADAAADNDSDDDSQNILSQTPVIKKGEFTSGHGDEGNKDEKQVTDADDTQNTSAQTYVTQKGESESIPCDEENEDEENIVSSTFNDDQVCERHEELLTGSVDIGKHILSETPVMKKGESISGHGDEMNKDEKQLTIEGNKNENQELQIQHNCKGELRSSFDRKDEQKETNLEEENYTKIRNSNETLLTQPNEDSECSHCPEKYEEHDVDGDDGDDPEATQKYEMLIPSGRIIKKYEEDDTGSMIVSSGSSDCSTTTMENNDLLDDQNDDDGDVTVDRYDAPTQLYVVEDSKDDKTEDVEKHSHQRDQQNAPIVGSNDKISSGHSIISLKHNLVQEKDTHVSSQRYKEQRNTKIMESISDRSQDQKNESLSLEFGTKKTQSTDIIRTSQVLRSSEISATDRNYNNTDTRVVKGHPETSDSDGIDKVNVCQKLSQSRHQISQCGEEPKRQHPQTTDKVTKKANDSDGRVMDHDEVILTTRQSTEITDDRNNTDTKCNLRDSSDDKERILKNSKRDQADRQQRNDIDNRKVKAKEDEEKYIEKDTEYPLTPTMTKASPKNDLEKKSSKKHVEKDIEVLGSSNRSNRRSQSRRKHVDGSNKDTTPPSSRKRTRMSPDNQKLSASYSQMKKELEMTESDNIRIIFTGLEITTRDRNMVASIGATLLENIEDAKFATHVIAGNGKRDSSLRRTPKLMICLCRTDNILHHDWLIQSSKVKKPLECFPFLLRDEKAESKYNFSMLETVKNRNELRQRQTDEFCDDNEIFLLGKYHVFFSKGVAGNKAPPSNELDLIIDAAGGTILRSLSQKSMSKLKESPHPCNILIVTSDPATSAQMSDKTIMKWNELGAKIVTTTWLFDCMMRQKVSFNDFVSNENECEKPNDTKSPKKGTKRRARPSEANDTANKTNKRVKRTRGKLLRS